MLRGQNVAVNPLRLVAAAFVVFGLFWGGWAVAAADVERDLGLSHGAFGLLLSVSLSGAAAANAVAGVLAERHGTTRTLAAAFTLWSLCLVAGAAARTTPLFTLSLIGIVGFGGAIDVVMNIAATSALASRPGALVRFHAFFNGGAAVGAAIMGLATAAGITWRSVWLGTALCGVALVLALRGRTLPAGAPGAQFRLRQLLGLLRRERLILIAVAFAVAAMVEGGIEVWGVLFIRTSIPEGLAVGATSAVLGYLLAAMARLMLGPAAGRLGAARGVTLGASLAAVGIIVLAVSPVTVAAGAGLVLAAGGISLCWPLFLSVAAAGRERPGAAVGAITSLGYLGFVVGPSVVGSLAGAAGLRSGLLALAGAAMFVALAGAAGVGRVGGSEQRSKKRR